MLHRLAFLALTLSLATAAEAQLDQRALDAALRTHRIDIPDYRFGVINDPNLTSSSSVTHVSGVNGIIAALPLNFTGTVAVGIGCPRTFGPATCTSSIGPMPYPAKLVISLNNVAPSNTLECANTRGHIAGGVVDVQRESRAMIRGINQFGKPVTERIPALTGAARYETIHAYEKVLRIDVTRCSGGGAGDQLVVAPSTAIAVPFKINTPTTGIGDVVLSLCKRTSATVERCVRGDQTRCACNSDAVLGNGSDWPLLGTAGVNVPSGASTCGLEVDRRAHTIDFSLMNFGCNGPPADGQSIVIHARAPVTGF